MLLLWIITKKSNITMCMYILYNDQMKSIMHIHVTIYIYKLEVLEMFYSFTCLYLSDVLTLNFINYDGALPAIKKNV